MNGRRIRVWGSLLWLMLAPAACGTSDTSAPDGGDGDAQVGSGSGSCTYQLFASTCETYTGTPAQVSSKVSACMRVFGGTAVATCPTSNVVGTCKVVPDSPNQTDEVFYYPGDAGPLSFSDLCSNANGTYTPTM
jgi:hypothetical protein